MHAQKLVEKAKDAVDRRAYDLAIELYMQALDLDPNHLEARRGLRDAELSKFEAFYPSRISRSLSSLGPRLAAWFAKVTKNHERQMTACERILANDPKNAAVGAVLAEAAVAAGHNDAAIAAYEGIIQSEPNHLEALKGLGRLLGQKGEAKEALEVYERALKISPRDQEANRMRKNLAAEVSITRAGLDQANHSRDILRDREKTSELEDSARVVRDKEEVAASVAALEESLKENPEDPRLMAEVAARYTTLRKYDEAIRAYDRAFELEPTNYLHREKAGDLRIARFDRQVLAETEAGNDAEADRLKQERLEFMVKEYRARVSDHPTDLVLHFHLGRALFETGDLDGAIGEFQQTVRDPRRKIESLTMLGNCFIQKGMFDLAENQLRKALEETPGMSERKKDILYGLGMLKERQDETKEALAEYKKIYEVDISFRDVSERMDKLKKKLADA